MMRLLITSIILLLFSCASNTSVFPGGIKNDKQSIIGTWNYAQQRNDNVTVGIWIINEDGTMESTMTIDDEKYILTGKWEVSGSTLTTQWKLLKKGDMYYQTENHERFKGLAQPSTSKILKVDDDILILQNKVVEKFLRE